MSSVIQRVLLLCPVLLLMLCCDTSSATPARGNHDNEYDWLCPRVLCNTLSDGCDNWEYIILQYTYRAGRRQVNIRCQSCPYCVDLPTRVGRRRRDVQQIRTRRSLYDLLGWTSSVQNTQACSNLDCPGVPDGCMDVRSTDVIIMGGLCQRCPACYDQTLLTNHETL